jgi:preprotein translocase subunit SecE
VAKTRAASKKKSNPVVRYLHETRAELKKVTWPTRPEATKLTIIVLVVVAFMSALLGTLDYIFSRLMGYIISLG